ncbi:hypothetical protein H257_17044 [Aphanomyces astaci]|uniref:Uncharacterized protein n=1 Tax=Aphanomyces astaci TaxID=112090 RepID=W4FG93_APHAT|nr:hypothetical protein H257_17044 [Aphanomyces astaci]ETV66460.1 hypothetical protein H257_17044 [Aphanomyces astaci]|eukprot:XP_009843989.1 hypothetical protein H257_17044 [Aphanomyces astaci]
MVLSTNERTKVPHHDPCVVHSGLRSFALVGPVGHYNELSLRLFPHFALLVTVVDFAHTVRSSNALLLVVRLCNRRAPQQNPQQNRYNVCGAEF